jgi:hypothetical protein
MGQAGAGTLLQIETKSKRGIIWCYHLREFERLITLRILIQSLSRAGCGRSSALEIGVLGENDGVQIQGNTYGSLTYSAAR